VIIKQGHARWALATALPLAWLVVVTFTTGLTKIFSPDPKLGFLAHARGFADALAAGRVPAGAKSAEAAARMIANDRLDAAVAGFFLVAVAVILADSLREWWAVLSGRKAARPGEVPYGAEPAVAGD
jgi:carbon starvation protein